MAKTLGGIDIEALAKQFDEMVRATDRVTASSEYVIPRSRYFGLEEDAGGVDSYNNERFFSAPEPDPELISEEDLIDIDGEEFL